jgi:hypothetical protein
MLVPTYDGRRATVDARGDMGVRLSYAVQDSAGNTYDSTGAFLLGQLEQLDRTLNEPLYSVSFGRDVDFRTDVTIGHEVASFTLSTFARSTGLATAVRAGGGKSWISANATQIPRASVDISKIPQALRLWGHEVAYTVIELERSALIGQGIDTQKYEALQTGWQLDTDAQVYVGDLDYGDTGLVNSGRVTNLASVATGAMGSTAWNTKTPREILNDVNELLTSVWAASGWSVLPNRVLIPPTQFGYITTEYNSEAGTQSILKYLEENNIVRHDHGVNLEFHPLKWLVGAGATGTLGTAGNDRIIAYHKDKKFIQFPRTPMAKTALQYDSIWQKTVYYAKLGQLEVRYPETVGYRDGI